MYAWTSPIGATTVTHDTLESVQFVAGTLVLPKTQLTVVKLLTCENENAPLSTTNSSPSVEALEGVALVMVGHVVALLEVACAAHDALPSWKHWRLVPHQEHVGLESDAQSEHDVAEQSLHID